MNRRGLSVSRIMKNIQYLTPREQKILTWYYQDHLASRKIAEEFGVSVSRISQIRLKSMNKLEKLLRPVSDLSE